MTEQFHSDVQSLSYTSRKYVQKVSEPLTVKISIWSHFLIVKVSLLFSIVEDQCSDIAKGHAVKDDVICKALSVFEAKFQNFVAQVNKMDVLFSSSFSQLKDIGKPFTRCGLTR